MGLTESALAWRTSSMTFPLIVLSVVQTTPLGFQYLMYTCSVVADREDSSLCLLQLTGLPSSVTLSPRLTRKPRVATCTEQPGMQMQTVEASAAPKSPMSVRPVTHHWGRTWEAAYDLRRLSSGLSMQGGFPHWHTLKSAVQGNTEIARLILARSCLRDSRFAWRAAELLHAQHLKKTDVMCCTDSRSIAYLAVHCHTPAIDQFVCLTSRMGCFETLIYANAWVFVQA